MGDEIGAGAPGVERIGGFEAGIEPRGDRGLRLRRDRGEGDAGAIGEIDQHFALAAGIADRDEAARRDAAIRGQQQQRGGEFVERLDPYHAVAIEQRAKGEVAAGDRARMGERARRRRLGSTDLERHDGNAALGRALERLREALRIARRFEKQADDLHLRPFDGIGDVIGDRRASPRRPGDTANAKRRRGSLCASAPKTLPEWAMKAIGARRGLARAREAAHPDPVELVVEAHAVRPADGNARLAREARRAAARAEDRRRPADQAGARR